MDVVFEKYLATDPDFPISDAPIWIFGRSYSIHYGKDLEGKDLEELRRVVRSCIWISYRKNFPPIRDSGLSSDKGWGCMIRVCQMVIGKALLSRYLGNWHWDPTTQNPIYLSILNLFGDTSNSLLSIHRISLMGASLGKPIGSWLGPNTAAQALKRIISQSNIDIEIIIPMESTLVREQIRKKCTENLTVPPPLTGIKSISNLNTPRISVGWKPLLLIIPLRLGLSELNPAYIPALRSVFEIKENIGMLGGRPNSALYFIGYAEDEVLFLDPHTVQPYTTIGSKVFETEKEGDYSYHIDKPGRIPFTSIDPSLAIAFFCPSENSFDNLCIILRDKFRSTPLPLFEITEKAPDAWIPLTENESISFSPSTSIRHSADEGGEEEFEILG